jgi:FkbM family methyltransferase
MIFEGTSVLHSIQRFVRECFRRQGVELARYAFPRLLATVDPELVLDVGANVGQYARELRTARFRGQIVSFEPLSSAHASLVRQATRDASWRIAPRMALGDVDGEATINIAGNSYSSSLMPMGKLHKHVAPEAGYVGSEKVRLHRLDSVAREFVGPGQRYMLKIDVQGYEQKVIAGAQETLRNAAALHMETSLVELYEGEAVISPLLDTAASLGFEIWSISPVFSDVRTGRLLQVDCFFVRPDRLPSGARRNP